MAAGGAVGMTEAKQQRSLVAKLCRVMADVDRIAKNGRNDFHRYDYVMEADLVDAVRTKLAAQNVFLFSTIDELSAVDKKTEKGKDTTVTTAKVVFTFVDGESGEERTFTYYGQGEDPADKGAYKAYTGAVKYALMKTFLIPTGDDPEDDENDKRRSGQQDGQQSSRGQANRSSGVGAQQARNGQSRNWRSGGGQQRPGTAPGEQQTQQRNGSVDDDADGRKYLFAQLNKLGIDVEVAKDWMRHRWAEDARSGAIMPESTKEIPGSFLRELADELRSGETTAAQIEIYVAKRRAS